MFWFIAYKFHNIIHIIFLFAFFYFFICSLFQTNFFICTFAKIKIMRKAFFLLILFAVGCSRQAISPETESGRQEEFTVSSSISNKKVNCIAQDADGCIWLGTFWGLNKYDSYNYRQYFCYDDEVGLQDNQINSLHRDRERRLWVATVNGIAVNSGGDGFRRIPDSFTDNRSMSGILETESGDIYFTDNYSLNRYDPATSPKAYRGQMLCADYEADEGAEVRLYYQNLRNGKCYLSEAGAREVRMTCEEDALIGRVGLLLSGGTVRLKSLSVSGKADYVLDFSKAWEEDYCLEHVEVEQCTYYRGNWRLEEGRLTGRCLADGQLFTGKPLGDVLFETAITPVAGSAFGVIFKAHGVRRQYRLQFARDKLAFVRLSDGERTLLTECAFPLTAGEHYRVQLVVVGKTMRAYVNGVERLAYVDEALPAFGYAGAAVSDGTAARFDRFVLKEL